MSTSKDKSKIKNIQSQSEETGSENYITAFGDNMIDYRWDGPDDPDEEIPEMV